MDRKQLNEKLKPFIKEANAQGYPLDDFCIEEAYPGDNSTSYILKVVAPWVDNMDCSRAIHILTEILWNTVDTETRKSVFSIFIHDSKNNFHCLKELEEE